MKIENKTIEFQTKAGLDFIDLTDDVEKFIKDSQIKNGIVNVQILHTSAALIVNENEPLLIEDFKNNLRQTAAKNLKYLHDDLQKRTVNLCPRECINGHSHCQAIHLLVNATLNLINNELQLGTWQRIFLVELDRPRKRKVQIQILGD
ncbi:MAG: secondary thiamine-phosphate synthase enzyme YjbQ [Candidatus Pacebacteria bacterium]|nr:secondary thiamine-phosphate synthase enzyme YjbQ [Candidatus Paceibacterota bacterium]